MDTDWKNVKEDLDISVKEVEKPLIEDVDIVLTTGKSGKSSYITTKLNGFLEAVIIDTNSDDIEIPPSIQVIITFADNDVPIFQIASVRGFHYIPLVVGQIDFKGETYERGVKYCLNDALRVDISGDKNIRVKIKFRVSKGR